MASLWQVEAMPAAPAPFAVRDWQAVARDYDALAGDRQPRDAGLESGGKTAIPSGGSPAA